MKKNYSLNDRYNVTNDSINEITKMAQENGGDVYCIQGCLNDALLIDVSSLKFGRVNRHWLLVVPEYLNSWGDELHAVLTDSKRIANKFIDDYNKQQDSVNIEGEPDFDPEAGDYRYYPAFSNRWIKSLATERLDSLKHFKVA